MRTTAYAQAIAVTRPRIQAIRQAGDIEIHNIQDVSTQIAGGGGQRSEPPFLRVPTSGLARLGREFLRFLEACPMDTKTKRQPISVYHGVASSFRRTGIREVAYRRPARALVRLESNT
jgi:hypothetical protein